MDITIGFSNDEHIISIEKDIINKHQNSMIYGYVNSGFYNGEKLLLDNINYDDFNLVLEVIKGNIPPWDVSNEISSYIDKQGFELDPIFTKYNDKLLKLLEDTYKCLLDEMNKKRNSMHQFICGTDVVLTYQSDYIDLFKGDKNIIQVNVVYFENTPIIIYVIDIPIYCAKIPPYKLIKEHLYKDMSDNVDVKDVTLKMYKILFDKVITLEKPSKNIRYILSKLESTYDDYSEEYKIKIYIPEYNVNINDLFKKEIDFKNLCEVIIKYFDKESKPNKYGIYQSKYFVNVKNLLNSKK